jgi:RNA polymerase nonessential primary-like sigma factor
MHDSTTAYFNEIGRIPLLTTEQEIQLGRQIQEMRAFQAEGREPATQAERRLVRNGQRAIKRMMESNLRLVVTIARKYYRMCQTLELMDVISLGNIGLAKAAEKFEPERGYKFSTYAYWWIWHSITRGVSDQDKIVRLPVHQIEKIGKIKKYQRQHPTASLTEAARATGVSMAELDIALRVWSLVSLDEVVIEDGNALVDAVADVDQSPDDELLNTTAREQLEQAMQHLQPIDQQIIGLRYGSHELVTLASIGKRLGVSRERVRQREKRALNRLRLLLEVAA